MPFGGELYTVIGARTGDNGLKYSSSTDNVRQKFTGYQKDTETSLDFAEARMYENRFGRFTAVDPLLASGKSAIPQTFNRYVYVGNSPLMVSDPFGLSWFKNGARFRWSDDNKKWADDGSDVDTKDWSPVDFNGSFYYAYDCQGCSPGQQHFLYESGGHDWGERAKVFDGFVNNARADQAYCAFSRECIALRNAQVLSATSDVMGMGAAVLNAVPGTYNLATSAINYFGGNLPYAPELSPDERTGLGQRLFFYGTNVAMAVESGVSAFRGVRGLFSAPSAIEKEVYSLRAAKDGMYPVYKRGFADPVGEVFLKRGEVWKFGETMNPATRYPQSFLKNTGSGLRYFPEGYKSPNFKDVFQFQKQKIIDYEKIFGRLPAGNKIRA